MPSESISVQVTPVMAEFIRTRIRNGDFASTDALILAAIERMRVSEASSLDLHDDVEAGLTKRQRQSVESNVRQGLDDLDAGRYDEFDIEGLRAFADNLVAASAARPGPGKGRKKA